MGGKTKTIRSMQTERTKPHRTNRTHSYSYYDYSLLLLTFLLVAFGLIMIYSTSSYSAQLKYGNSMYFLKRQGTCAIVGIFAMLFVSKIDYRIFLKKIPIFHIRLVTVSYILCILLQMGVIFTPLGQEINGAKRWIKLGPLSFQPSDLSKVAVILFVSYMIYLAPKRVNKFRGFLRIVCYLLPMIVLIGRENMSTAIIIVGVIGGLCFVTSRKKGYFFIAILVAAIGMAAYVLFGEGFRLERFQIWLNVETHPKGFQILQGLYAIASGGLTGTGLGGSMQKLGYVPEAQNDMIFSIICEELGLFGALAVMILFGMLIWRLFMISINAPDLFGGLVGAGILIHVALQVVINIAVVTNSIPSTGIALPFISYGGTSVMVMLAEIGLALSISNQITYKR